VAGAGQVKGDEAAAKLGTAIGTPTSAATQKTDRKCVFIIVASSLLNSKNSEMSRWYWQVWAECRF
jgi:hypothetical protein